MSEFASNALMRGFDTNGELRPHWSEAPHSYKKTSLGWIPKEWDVLTLGEVASSIIDGPFGSNLKTEHYVVDPGVRVVRLQNIQQGKYDDNDRAFISEQRAAALARHYVTGGDVLIASLGDDHFPVGRACCYPVDLPDAINKADCFRLRSGSRCRNEFVMLFMNSNMAKKQIRRYEQGVTMKRINLGNLRKILIAVPPICEQEMIIAQMSGVRPVIGAHSLRRMETRPSSPGVIDTLSAEIHETEAIIRKLKAVKQGLLHDLLTRGIDANGELRPPQSEAPHLYKESPLGWIPIEWENAELGSVTVWVSGGTPSKDVLSNWVGAVPLLTPKDMKSFEINDASEHISANAAKTGSKIVPAGATFIVVRGMILAHSFPVALSCRPMAFNQDIKAVIAGPRLSGRFLAHWFVANSSQFLRKVTAATHGTKKLDMGELLLLPIGVPTLVEQRAIVERYEATDCRLRKESLYLAQLRALKSGLMDDLLTGRVRVTPLLEQAGEPLLAGGK